MYEMRAILKLKPSGLMRARVDLKTIIVMRAIQIVKPIVKMRNPNPNEGVINHGLQRVKEDLRKEIS